MMSLANLKVIVLRVAGMTQKEITAYTEIVSLSKVDAKARKFLYKAIDLRQKELDGVISDGMAVYANIPYDEEES